MLNGYVVNNDKYYVYYLRRAIKSKGEVPIQELYDDYGTDMDEDEFIEWIKSDIILKNKHLSVI